MGSFNTTGFLSKIPIRYGDRVVCFLAKVAKNADVYGCTPYYPFSIVGPICLPVRGKYNDYGSIEDVDDTPMSSLICKLTEKENIEDVFDGVSQCADSPIEYELNHWHYSEDGVYEDDWYKEECEKIVPILKLYNKEDVPTLLFEHESFYDKFTEENHFILDWNDEKRTKWDIFWDGMEKLGEAYEKFPEEMEVSDKRPYCHLLICDNDSSQLGSDIFLSYTSFIMKTGQKPNEDFVNAVKDIQIDAPMHYGEGERPFSLLKKLAVKTAFELYKESKEEIRRLNNMRYALMSIPMYCGLSKTAGEQSYNFKALKKFYELAIEKTDELISYDRERWGDELEEDE